MRDNRREPNYGEYNRRYDREDENRHFAGPYKGRRHADLGDTRREQGEYYRMQQSEEYGRRGGDQGTKEDYYKSYYDISNYDGVPRSYNYGLLNGPVDELNEIRHYSKYEEGPYTGRTHYRYTQGYNANYDNPEEGDRYRDFDSRGNHGFRHDPGYGVSNEFRDFDDEQFDNPNERRNNRNDYYGVQNRY